MSSGSTFYIQQARIYKLKADVSAVRDLECCLDYTQAIIYNLYHAAQCVGTPSDNQSFTDALNILQSNEVKQMIEKAKMLNTKCLHLYPTQTTAEMGSRAITSPAFDPSITPDPNKDRIEILQVLLLKLEAHMEIQAYNVKNKQNKMKDHVEKLSMFISQTAKDFTSTNTRSGKTAKPSKRSLEDSTSPGTVPAEKRPKVSPEDIHHNVSRVPVENYKIHAKVQQTPSKALAKTQQNSQAPAKTQQNPSQVHAKTKPNPSKAPAKTLPNPPQAPAKLQVNPSQAHAKTQPNPPQVPEKTYQNASQVTVETQNEMEVKIQQNASEYLPKTQQNTSQLPTATQNNEKQMTPDTHQTIPQFSVKTQVPAKAEKGVETFANRRKSSEDLNKLIKTASENKENAPPKRSLILIDTLKFFAEENVPFKSKENAKQSNKTETKVSACSKITKDKKLSISGKTVSQSKPEIPEMSNSSVAKVFDSSDNTEILAEGTICKNETVMGNPVVKPEEKPRLALKINLKLNTVSSVVTMKHESVPNPELRWSAVKKEPGQTKDFSKQQPKKSRKEEKPVLSTQTLDLSGSKTQKSSPKGNTEVALGQQKVTKVSEKPKLSSKSQKNSTVSKSNGDQTSKGLPTTDQAKSGCSLTMSSDVASSLQTFITASQNLVNAHELWTHVKEKMRNSAEITRFYRTIDSTCEYTVSLDTDSKAFLHYCSAAMRLTTPKLLKVNEIIKAQLQQKTDVNNNRINKC